jgi:integrase
VRRRLASMKALLATAVEDGLLRANPSAGVRIGSPVADEHEDGEQVKALTLEQLARLLDAVPEGWRRLLVATLAQTGLRISEALGLRWADVDHKRCRLLIRRRVRDGEVGATKSRQGRREVPIAPPLSRELAAHRLASPWSADADYVFSADAGGPIVARNLYRWFTPAAERAGVGWAGFHALRHTAASRWLMAGVSIAQVSRLLGHADAGFTLRGIRLRAARRPARWRDAGLGRGLDVIFGNTRSRGHHKARRSGPLILEAPRAARPSWTEENR